MSAIVRIQKVDRGHTRSLTCYLNFPAALAEGMHVKKGEQFEWVLEDKNTVWLRRVVPKPLRSAPKKSAQPLYADPCQFAAKYYRSIQYPSLLRRGQRIYTVCRLFHRSL